MLIARVKKESNIVEYILYMYQIEDVIRSFDFDIARINQEVVQKFEQPEKVKIEIEEWYLDLIEKMTSQGIQKKGHLAELQEIIDGLQVLHHSLLTTFQDKAYQEQYEKAKAILLELKHKTGSQEKTSEMSVAINGLYGLLLLRLKGKTVSEETTDGMAEISKLLALLAFQSNQMKMGKLRFPKELNN